MTTSAEAQTNIATMVAAATAVLDLVGTKSVDIPLVKTEEANAAMKAAAVLIAAYT